MWPGDPAPAHMPVDSLDSPELLPVSPDTRLLICRPKGAAVNGRDDAKTPLRGRREHVVRGGDGGVRVVIKVLEGRAREVLRDFDLDIALVQLSCRAFALLLVGIVRLGRARRPALQTAVVVMGDEWLPLVALRGAVRVDIVHVGEVCLEPEIGGQNLNRT